MSNNEQLSAGQVADLLGIKRDTWAAYVTRNQAPPPDGRIGPNRWWWRSTIERYAAGRTRTAPPRPENVA